jgi:hypothetical protein
LDGAAAAPMEREEGKADGSKVAAARVGCCVLVEMLYSVDVLYGTILLHNYEMLAFPDIKMREKRPQKNYVGVATSPCWQNLADIVVCRRHVGDMLPTFPAKNLTTP